MTSLRRWLLYFSATALPLLIVAIGVVHLLFQWHVRPLLDRNRHLQERHIEAFSGDLQYLLKVDLPFKARSQERDRDAGAFLNSRVFWFPASQGFPAEPKVSKNTKETLLRFRDDWIKKFERVRHMPADLSIFSDLARFDYWDIEAASPIAVLIHERQFVPPPLLPIPDTADLLALVKIRLMNGALTGKFTDALTDVRNLARLMLSTENIQLILAGLAALDYERIAHRFYAERGMPPRSWTPIDRNATRRAHRAILATRAYLHLWTAPKTLERIFLSEHSSTGLCAAANEAFPMEFALRPLLHPQWPAEMSLKTEYEYLDRVYQRARGECRLRYISALVDNQAIQVRVPGPFMLIDLPYIRKVFGLRSGVTNFQGLEAYEAASY